jgi:hypothetical protein
MLLEEINMIKRILFLIGLFILIQGCNMESSSSIPTEVNENQGNYFENSTFTCGSILQITYGDTPDAFSSNTLPIPSFITFDPNGTLYLDDQVNSRIFKYSDIDEPPTSIIIPEHRSDNIVTLRPYWLGIVVTNDRIYILHNPATTPENHLLLSVHEIDGNEIFLLDVNSLSIITERERNVIAQNWMLFSLYSDGHGGVFINLPVEGNFLHFNSDNIEQVTVMHPAELGFEPVGNFVSGWNGVMYSRSIETNRIVMIQYGTGQNMDWSDYNNALQHYGFETSAIIGIDLEGTTLFSESRGYGLFNPESGEILFSTITFPENGDSNIESSDHNLVMAPDGAIYRFDSTNWPESRELLRCEFVPLP